MKDINDHIKLGDEVEVKVLSVDEATGKISLSIKKPSLYQMSSQELQDSRSQELIQLRRRLSLVLIPLKISLKHGLSSQMKFKKTSIKEITDKYISPAD